MSRRTLAGPILEQKKRLLVRNAIVVAHFKYVIDSKRSLGRTVSSIAEVQQMREMAFRARLLSLSTNSFDQVFSFVFFQICFWFSHIVKMLVTVLSILCFISEK